MGFFGRANSTRKQGPSFARNDTWNFRDSYDVIKTLGSGGQGKLCVVKRKSDKKVLVRKEQKEFSMHGSTPREMYLFEHVLTYHPSIIQYDHGNYINTRKDLILYFELCKGGDLHEQLPREGESGRSEKFIWRCFIQLADAIAFLHYGYNRFADSPYTPPRGWQRIVHRDLKPANVFLRRQLTSKNPFPEVVLGDFGLATLNDVSHSGGTDEWIGPEIPTLTKENDVWGVGAIVHALAHGVGPVAKPPRGWPKDKAGKDAWYTDPKARIPRPLPKKYSSTLNENMMDCLVMDKKNRISSLDLLDNLVKEGPKGTR